MEYMSSCGPYYDVCTEYASNLGDFPFNFMFRSEQDLHTLKANFPTYTKPTVSLYENCKHFVSISEIAEIILTESLSKDVSRIKFVRNLLHHVLDSLDKKVEKDRELRVKVQRILLAFEGLMSSSNGTSKNYQEIAKSILQSSKDSAGDLRLWKTHIMMECENNSKVKRHLR